MGNLNIFVMLFIRIFYHKRLLLIADSHFCRTDGNQRVYFLLRLSAPILVHHLTPEVIIESSRVVIAVAVIVSYIPLQIFPYNFIPKLSC